MVFVNNGNVTIVKGGLDASEVVSLGSLQGTTQKTKVEMGRGVG